jgi:N-acyl-D-aspartate/D-glutamate deacylase
VVAPGFVDIHTHYDAQVFWDRSLSPSGEHGVTTVIGGNCGFSIAPLSGKADDADYLMRMLARVEGMPLESLRQGVPWDWLSFEEYLAKLDGKLALNAGFMVGHSALRRAVMGERAVGNKASAEEIGAMQALLRQSLAAGGLGFSSTINRSHNDAEGNPVPSRHAADEEFIALASVVGEFPGTALEFLPMIGLGFDEDQMRRMTEMSLAANRPLNWNVLNPDSRHPDMAKSFLAASDYAAERGAKVVALAAAQSNTLWINFHSGFILDMFPGWTELFRLRPPERLKALADPAMRRKLDDGAHSRAAGAMEAFSNWAAWTVAESFSPQNRGFAGETIATIAARLGKTPFDTLLDIVVADELKTSLIPPKRGNDEASWQMRGAIWRDDRTVIGASDAGAHLDMIDSFAYSSQILGVGVRERKLIGLEEAVRQLTDLPARLYGLRERGRLERGWHADIVVFDPARIAAGPPHMRFDLPAGAGRLYAEAIGVSHVIVNGREIHRRGEFTKEHPGTLLRSGRDTETVEVPKGRRRAGAAA